MSKQDNADVHPPMQLPRVGHHSERMAPPEPAIASYASNRLCIMPGGRRGLQLWIEPVPFTGTTDLTQVPDELAALLPFTFVSAWNTDGDRATRGENKAAHARLLERVEALALESVHAVAVARQGIWFEQGLAIADATDAVAAELAYEFLQLAAIRVDADGWHVISRATGLPLETLAYRVVPRMRRRCPVRQFDARIDRCTMWGGPWTSASMVAAGVWRTHRDLGIELLGCSTCQDGKQPVYGPGRQLSVSPARGVMLIREVMVGSRHGGYCFGRFERSDSATDAPKAGAQ